MRPFSRLIALTWISMISATSCATAATTADVVAYNGWPNAYRLSNGTVELIFVPAVGRIMHYGYVGAPNLLWENEALGGKPASTQPTKWTNFGGDKVFPWPQRDWTARFGHDWPPPPGFDPLLYQVEILPDHSLHVVSKPVAAYGLRVTRDIRLADVGTAVTTTTVFEQVEAPTTSSPLAVWTVTQWPAPDFILARMCQPSAPSDVTPLFGHFKNIGSPLPRALVIEPRPDEAGKLGLDADELGVLVGDQLIIQRSTHTGDEGPWHRGERAQVYCDKNPSAAKKSYVELEFTSPPASLQKGQKLQLQVDWEVRSVTTAQRQPQQLAELLDNPN